jgi:very-short-patch-repair endonuclease
MPRDEAEYAALKAEFEARRGKVRTRVTSGPRQRKPKPTAEQAFAQAWEASLQQPFAPQYRFHAEREWSFDFAWPAQKVALELEGFGAGGGGGRHHLPAGIIADAEKFRVALLLGWRVLRVPSRGGRDVKQWVEWVKQLLAQSPPPICDSDLP